MSIPGYGRWKTRSDRDEHPELDPYYDDLNPTLDEMLAASEVEIPLDPRQLYALRTRHLVEIDSRRPKYPYAEGPQPIGRLARLKPLPE